MAEGEQQQDQPEAKAPATKKGGDGFAAVLPWLIAFAPQIIAVLAFVVFLAVVLAIINSQKALQPPDMSGEGGSTTCASWVGAPLDLQLAITTAAKKADIQPALLGAIFLSEHGDTWKGPFPNGKWESDDTSSKGPFQIEQVNWNNWWNQAKSLGLTNKNVGDADPENPGDSAIAAAGSIKNALKHIGTSTNTSEQKYIMYMGMYHNRGSGNADDWAKNFNFSLTDAPVNEKNPGWIFGAPYPATEANRHNILKQYAFRTWANFQNLNKGCSSATALGASGMPLYLQNDKFTKNDPKWGAYRKVPNPKTGTPIFSSGSSIAQAGCGLTSAAMVASYLKGDKTITPLTMATCFVAHGGNGLFGPSKVTTCSGIKSAKWPDGSVTLWVQPGKEIPKADIKSELDKKHSVIMDMTQSTAKNGKVFVAPSGYKQCYGRGHYLVVTGIVGEEFIVNDPAGCNTKLPIDATSYKTPLRFYSFSS